MTATIEAPRADSTRIEDVALTGGASASPSPRARMRGFFDRHRRSIAWLTPALVIAGLIQAINMAGSPQRIDDEGTYTAQAWAVDKLGELAHYTYWYDHPPLGWLQIAGYTRLTGAFDRYDVAVIAAREAMLVAMLISATLLFFLARRLRFSRAASAATMVIFAASPLALQFHRSVYLDNVATPWLLAAFLLALSRKHQLASFAGAAAAFGIAVLSKETFLLALPFLVWVVWRNALPATRRYTLSVAASILVLIGGSYILLAVVKGELTPGANRVSLFDGIAFQLASRDSSGSLADPESLIRKTLSMWWQLDPTLIVAGVIAAVAGLFVRAYRPFAALLVFLLFFMLRPGGYLPVPYVIVLVPFAALLIAGITDRFVRGFRRRKGLRRTVALAWTAGATAAVVIAAPLWTTQLRGFVLADLDKPMRQAETWVEANVPSDSRLIVDDSMWVDLVNAGFTRENVIWYYKLDTDSAVMADSPDGWRDSDYIITTDSMRTFPTGFPQVSEAIANSTVVASFGSATQQVDVRRIHPEGLETAEATAKADTAGRAQSGSELRANPDLTIDDAAAGPLADGLVDVRIQLVLAQKLATSKLTVADFPIAEGEGDEVRRQVLISSVDGRDATGQAPGAADAEAWFNGLSGTAKPTSLERTPDGVLATYSALEPTALIAAR